MTKNKTNTRKYRQEIWEEVAGILTSFRENNGVLDVNMGKITLILPYELEDTLESLVGQRISILRTDISGKYLFRIIPEEAQDPEMESAAIAVQAASTETNAHQRKARGRP